MSNDYYRQHLQPMPTRLLVIEETAAIEELISESLGYRLNIDWKQSKSLGFRSSALSFSQKVELFKDSKGILDDDKKKFVFLMRIRNKFAHVKSVDTFDNFSKEYDQDDEVYNMLKKWYGDSTDSKNEEHYRKYFQSLVRDIFKLTLAALLTSIREQASAEGLAKAREEFISNLSGLLPKYPEAQAFWKAAIEMD